MLSIPGRIGLSVAWAAFESMIQENKQSRNQADPRAEHEPDQDTDGSGHLTVFSPISGEKSIAEKTERGNDGYTQSDGESQPEWRLSLPGKEAPTGDVHHDAREDCDEYEQFH